MQTVTLGKTGITVPKNGFGCLPLQRTPMDEAVRILERAYEAGITFYDTARAYTDSEEKVGNALSSVRKNIYIATKSQAQTTDDFWKDLETSLKTLKTDYIDIYQFHNLPFCPKPGDDSGLYDAALKAKEEGLIRHIGITNHRLHVAEEAIASGLFDTLQFPFSHLSGEPDIKLVEACKAANMGFLAMKALSGGLITNAKAAYAYLSQFDHVLPLWGMQHMHELEEFLAYGVNPPALDAEMLAVIEKDRQELIGDFCRSCGYCMPCPVGIEISNCARMMFNMRRMPSDRWLTEEWQEKMMKIEDCLHCGQCASKCPYSLDTPALLAKNLADYKDVLSGKVSVE